MVAALALGRRCTAARAVLPALLLHEAFQRLCGCFGSARMAWAPGVHRRRTLLAPGVCAAGERACDDTGGVVVVSVNERLTIAAGILLENITGYGMRNDVPPAVNEDGVLVLLQLLEYPFGFFGHADGLHEGRRKR